MNNPYLGAYLEVKTKKQTTKTAVNDDCCGIGYPARINFCANCGKKLIKKEISIESYVPLIMIVPDEMCDNYYDISEVDARGVTYIGTNIGWSSWIDSDEDITAELIQDHKDKFMQNKAMIQFMKWMDAEERIEGYELKFGYLAERW